MRQASVRLLILTVLGIVAVPTVSWACRCVEPEIAAAYKSAKLAVQGRVLSVMPRKEIDGFEMRFQVSQVWKADVPKEIFVTTGTDCRYEVKEGGDYLLFLARTPTGGFTTGRCMGNGDLASRKSSIAWLTKRGQTGRVLH
jgi:hypothetical protein